MRHSWRGGRHYSIPRHWTRSDPFPGRCSTNSGRCCLISRYGARIGMPSCRPMPSVAPGVEELRVRDQTGIYRVFYTLKLENGVVVFHAFQKKSQKTPPHEIELARK